MLPSNIIFSIDQYSTNSTSPSKNWKICLSKNHNYSIFQDEHFINTAKGKFLLYIGTSLYYFLIQNKIETNYMLTDSVLMPMRSLEDINHIQLPHTNYHNFNINNNSISYKSIKSDYLYKNINFWDGINNSFLADIFPLKVINRILSDQNKHSIRKRLLPSNMLVYLIIALNLWRQIEIPEVFKVVCAGLAIKCPSFTYNAGFPKQAAISRARSRLGPKVMEELANETLDWLAPVEMKSAWYKDMRLVAIDGTTFDVPDEKINDAYFGRSKTVRGYSAYPQARVLALTEIGTRAIYSGLIGKYKDSEVTMAKELFSSLSKLDANILMLADRGFYGYPLWSKFLETGAKGLWRVKKNLSTRPLTHLPDGSYLSYVYDSKNRKKCDPIKVRIIRSTINFIDENGNKATEI
jgi:hypothetical protein